MQEIKEHLVEIIEANFSNEIYLFLHLMDDFCLDINWKLNNDSNRPNKRSRKLRLIISKEKLEDYRDANDKVKGNYDQKLKKFIANTMVNFIPDHDAPHGATEPVETIHVPIQITY